MGERPAQNDRVVSRQHRVDRTRAKRRVPRVLRAPVWNGGRRKLKVAVTGAGGLLGRAANTHCAAQGDEVHAFDHGALDITDAAAVKSQLSDLKPDVVFNCAAWTDVDGCESDPNRAERANALGPQLLASTCRDIDALLITVSTDYVFDGTKEGFYTQRDHPNPISVYGRFKLEGERRAQTTYATHDRGAQRIYFRRRWN